MDPNNSSARATVERDLTGSHDATCNPFGPSLQKYWDRRYDYLSKFDEGIQTDEEGLYSIVPEQAALAQANLVQGTVVLDGFTGIGGSAIAFARAGKQVITVDTNARRLAMAEHNSEVYGVRAHITFINGDFFEVACDVKADAVNLDPPWGGPEYKRLGRFLLSHFNPDGNRLLKFALPRFRQVLLRVPLIFDFSELTRFRRRYSVHDDLLNGNPISKTVAFFRHRRTVQAESDDTASSRLLGT